MTLPRFEIRRLRFRKQFWIGLITESGTIFPIKRDGFVKQIEPYRFRRAWISLIPFLPLVLTSRKRVNSAKETL